MLQGRGLREPMTGRRPEDLFMVPAGLRQVALAPIRCAGTEGTLQLGRRLPRAYSAGELMVLQLLAERLGLLFAGGLAAAATNQALEVR
jgi:GAF domain-containing protein